MNNEKSQLSLDELLNEICPNRVEWKPFSSLCTYTRGVTYNKNQEVQSAQEQGIGILRANNIDVLRNDFILSNIKYVNTTVRIKPTQMLHAEDILICAGSGSKEHIGKIAYAHDEMPFAFGGFMAVIRTINQDMLNSRFLYHCLSSQRFKNYFLQKMSASTINNLNATVISEFLVPVPPLDVQVHIAHILDLLSELTSELTSEREARQSQYEWYRNHLLDKDTLTGGEGGGWQSLADLIEAQCPDGVEWKELQEVAHIKHGRDYKHLDDGNIPVWGSGGYMGINVSQCSYDKPTVLIPRKGSLANIFYLDEPFWNVDTVFYTEINDSIILPRFFYHVITNAHVERYNKSSARPSLTQEILNHIKVPVPPLDVQLLIVDLLDKLDDYAVRIDGVLPREITASQQRYEWWRDHLLDFRDMRGGGGRA